MTKINSKDFSLSASDKYKKILEVTSQENTDIPPEILALEVRETALKLLIDILEILEERGEKYSGKSGEEEAQKLITRFINQNKEARKNFDALVGEKNAPIPSVENLLDKISQSIGKILISGAIETGEIYKKSAKGNDGIIPGDGRGLEEVKSAPKFDTLIKVIDMMNISPKHISITKEKVNPKRMRVFPYHIVHIFDEKHNCTITVSDEIGQATYVYPGYVSLHSIKEGEKGKPLDGVTPQKVTYSDTYKENLLHKIQNIKKADTKEENHTKVSEKTPEIMRHQAKLLQIVPKLKEIGLIEYDGVFYFHNLQRFTKWPDIGGKKLASFPYADFNKKNGIGSKNGIIQSPQHLKKLFELLGIKVADTQKEKKLFKSQVLEIIPELKKVGLEEYGGVFYFHNLQGYANWPIIGEKKLMYFPHTGFNKKNGIGSKNGKIQSPQQLKKLFEFLGIKVADIEKEKKLFKSQVLEIIPELKEIGLEEYDGVFYFHNLQGFDKWPIIGEKKLMSFPYADFNKKNGIGSKNGIIQNPQQLKKLFEFLGLSVSEN